MIGTTIYEFTSHVPVTFHRMPATADMVVVDAVGFQGELVFDTSKPDGTPQKLLDVSRLRGLGWSPTKSLREGIGETYAWYAAKVQPAATVRPRSAAVMESATTA